MSSQNTNGAADRASESCAEFPPCAFVPSLSVAPRTPGDLTWEERSDLDAKMMPAHHRALEFDAFWSVWSSHGDHIAALTAGLAAAACRYSVHEIHATWFSLRKLTLTVDSIDSPIVTNHGFDDRHLGETREQALDRLVAGIEEHDEETLAPLAKTLGLFGLRTIGERLAQLRDCPEWSNPNGIVRDHPPEGCTALFRTLLVSAVVHFEVQDDLSEISALRREARRFREKIVAFDQRVGLEEDAERADARFLPDLSHVENERFRESLDSLCAGDIRTRHRNEHADRIAIIRAISDHFRRHLNITRKAATEAFRVEPWSTGIAAFASVGLGRLVTAEDVRGALKNWPAD